MLLCLGYVYSWVIISGFSVTCGLITQFTVVHTCMWTCLYMCMFACVRINDDDDDHSNKRDKTGSGRIGRFVPITFRTRPVFYALMAVLYTSCLSLLSPRRPAQPRSHTSTVDSWRCLGRFADLRLLVLCSVYT